VRLSLVRHGITLSLTAEGKIKPKADQPPPAELVEGMREHREHLVRQLKEGRLPDGRLDVAALSLQPGRCASCGWWIGPDEYGDGRCPLGRAAHGWPDGNPNEAVLTTALHHCQAREGRGWEPKL
jgi:hypothetical protein